LTPSPHTPVRHCTGQRQIQSFFIAATSISQFLLRSRMNLSAQGETRMQNPTAPAAGSNERAGVASARQALSQRAEG
jgi:hypothetical protein